MRKEEKGNRKISRAIGLESSWPSAEGGGGVDGAMANVFLIDASLD